MTADAKQQAGGADPPPSKDHTKEPSKLSDRLQQLTCLEFRSLAVMDAMWKNVRPVQRVMSDTSDGWERFAK